MPTTHEQKADIGQRYMAEIKRRIDVRNAAHKSAADQAAALSLQSSDGYGCPELEKIALKVAKAHRFATVGATIASEYRRGEHEDFLHLYGRDGSKLRLPIAKRPDLADIVKLQERRTELDKRRSDICDEIQILKGALAPAQVASFQAHASRLWAPNGKADTMPEALFKVTLDDFLTGKRPAVCAA